ncbi:MAG: DUF2382 domain-containing protein [Chloroflexota bacterium]|nr:DUF2382 domain-containing protein [Chloroflexota bacterium]
MTTGRSEFNRANTGANDYTASLVAGADVYGSDNEKIGTIADVGQNYFLVQKGWLFIKDLYLPTSAIMQADGNNVYLSITKHEAEQIGRDDLPNAGDAWYGTQRTDSTANREVGRGVSEGENVSVPIVEEQLKADVRETEAGRARVVKGVHEERQSIDVPVEHEELYVTERAVNRPATEADVNMQDRDINIPLREQEVVTQKQAMVTGEINVRKETVTDTERVTDTVRRENVHVEEANNPRVHVENERGMTGRTADRGADTTYKTTGPTGPTDTAYDRTGMAGDRYEADRSGDEGIIDRAKDKLRDGENRTQNR